MANPPTSPEDALFRRVVDILEAARGQVARSVNTAMVQAYWLVGREIVEVEQQGDKRAGYGERLIPGLAARLATHVGKGFSVPSLERMRRFFLAYPERIYTGGGTWRPTQKQGNIRYFSDIQDSIRSADAIGAVQDSLRSA